MSLGYQFFSWGEGGAGRKTGWEVDGGKWGGDRNWVEWIEEKL